MTQKRIAIQVDTSKGAWMGGNKNVKMKQQEPKHTIDWTAYHKYDKLFYAKYETGKLTMNEYCGLINFVIIQRRLHIDKNRKWYELRLRWKDYVFLRSLKKLRGILQKRTTIPSFIEGGIVKGNPIGII